MSLEYIQIFQKVLGYKISRSLNLDPPLPINFTVSVTNTCNSECKTCFIWKLYQDRPELKEKELKTWEFERLFQSLGKTPVWFTFSGGEPFLRSDFTEICDIACELCDPRVVSIPTNSLSPSLIERKTREILEKSHRFDLIINMSLDGIDERHDEIRGVRGNFDRFLDTYSRLERLKVEFPRLSIGVHTVVSRFNINDVLGLYDFVRTLDPDSHISEVAENRTELFNTDVDIMPDTDLYAKVIDAFSHRIEEDYVQSRGSVQKLTQAFRVIYYRKLANGLRANEQLIPCYAGYASCQVTPFGDVWPCCILGYDMSMGNLRENNYDFGNVWLSERAREVRRHVRSGSCGCPLANAHYTSMLCSFREMLRVIWFMVRNF